MNQLPMFDIAVIGGGLAGLAAATYAAREGRTVIVLEKGPQPGGRATTHDASGFLFNQGPHALYRSGDGVGVLRELGVDYRGAQASSEGSWALRDGEKFPLPRTPESIMASKLLSEGARREAVALFAGLRQLPTSDWAHLPLREWLDTQVQHADLRAHFEALVRLSTYCNEPSIQSAGAALEQTILGGDGVDYLDGGWQSLVDGLRAAAAGAGVRIETRSSVEHLESDGRSATIRVNDGDTIAARMVISATAPATIARLVSSGSVPSLVRWAHDAVPIHAACLDVALKRLPYPQHQFAIGLDQPLYYSVHTRSARLAPGDAVVIQLAKYLPSHARDAAGDVEAELESLLDALQPGWRSELVTKRFLPRMLVSNAVVTAAQGGTAGRPGPRVPELPNLFIAGDWVGPRGMLADASLASARAAALMATRELEGVNPAVPSPQVPAGVR